MADDSGNVLEGLLGQLQGMQGMLQRMEESMAGRKFEAEAGHGAVKVVVSGRLRVLSVKMDPKILDPEDPEMVEDLVVAAVNRALDGIRAEMAKEMSGGLFGGPPPGFG